MASLKEVLITDIEEFDSVDVVEVLVKEGDAIDVDQPIITIESEKAMMDFPSPYQGIVQKINVNEGGQVKEGDVLVTLEVSEDSADSADSAEPSPPENPETTASKPKDDAGSSPPNLERVTTVPTQDSIDSTRASVNTNATAAYASPGVQKYARKLGVDLNHVVGSGRTQRVLQEDVQQFVRTHLSSNSSVKSASKPLKFTAYGETEAKDLTKIQKVTISNMLNAWHSIPHVTHFDQADVTLLEKHRKQLANELKEKNIKLTPLAFVIKALVVCLKQYPIFNSSLDTVSEKLIYKKFFHIGIAVDTPHGLLVPVIRDVDKKSITHVASELMELSELARQRKLTHKQMSGASISISSLGILGGQAFTPIINPPEVAILGLSKMSVKEIITVIVIL